MNPIFGPIVGTILEIIGRIVPDPQKQAEMQLEVLRMNQAGEFKQLETDLAMATGQMTTNTEEAKSTSMFVAGWRPFVGWVCGIGFAVQVLGPLLQWTAALFGHPVAFPQLDFSIMAPTLAGMLGLGAMRSFEKWKGVEGNR